MKRPVEWHEDCLANMQNSLIRKQFEVERHIQSLERLRANVDFYAMQIGEARKRRKDGFDAEKFMASQKPNTND